VNPLTGIWATSVTVPCYWYGSPNGDVSGRGKTAFYRAFAPAGAGGAPTIVHCSLYIVHCWSFTFSAKERDSETGLSYFGSRYYSSDLSIWLSVDPMSDKYASLSPYVYCADNPVRLVDPDGEDYDVFITGEGAEWVTQQLSDTYQNLNITRDQFGRLHTNVDDVSSLTKDEKLIYDAINSNNVVVNMDVTNNTRIQTEFGDFKLDRASGFLGNRLSDDKNMVFTRQVINKKKLISTYYPKDRGRLIAHELTESYLGGRFSLDNKCLAPPAMWVDGQNPIIFNQFYRYAHNNAILQPYNKGDYRKMFCEGFSCNKYIYDLFVEKALRR
jgi:RHS repeat-associated protein